MDWARNETNELSTYWEENHFEIRINLSSNALVFCNFSSTRNIWHGIEENFRYQQLLNQWTSNRLSIRLKVKEIESVGSFGEKQSFGEHRINMIWFASVTFFELQLWKLKPCLKKLLGENRPSWTCMKFLYGTLISAGKYFIKARQLRHLAYMYFECISEAAKVSSYT